MEHETNNTPAMADFEKEINDSFKKISEGDMITGTVISVSEKEITLIFSTMPKESSRWKITAVNQALSPKTWFIPAMR